MSGIGDQTRWRGVQPTDPAVDIPVTLDGEALAIEVPVGATQYGNAGGCKNSSTTLHTVTAGKTFYLTGYGFSAFNEGIPGGAATLIIYTNLGASYHRLQKVMLGNLQGFTTGRVLIPPYEIPATYYIDIESDQTGLQVYGELEGYEI